LALVVASLLIWRRFDRDIGLARARLSSEIGVPTDLIAAGTSLENPYVYGSVARELKSMANQGLIRITAESLATNATEPLIDRIRFERVR
jgi:hypothetical protein